MIDKPGLLNKYYSFFLIAMGIIGFAWRYTTEFDLQFTALIPAIFGLILLPMSKPITKENHVVAHIAVTITLIFGLIALYMFITSLTADAMNIRKAILFGLMFIASDLVTLLYVLRFIRVKKERLAQVTTKKSDM